MTNQVFTSLPPTEGKDLLNLQISWLEAEMDAARAYHHQKEQMAWTGTAFYVGVVTLFANSPAPTGLPLSLSFSIFLSLSAALFIGMQFEFRWRAADQLVALRRARGKLLSGQIQLGPEDLLITDEVDSLQRRASWPRFLREELSGSVRPRSKREPWAAVWFLLTFRFSRLREVSGRVRSEVASYGIVFMATIFAVLVDLL
jgi:hypothetical protein